MNGKEEKDAVGCGKTSRSEMAEDRYSVTKAAEDMCSVTKAAEDMCSVTRDAEDMCSVTEDAAEDETRFCRNELVFGAEGVSLLAEKKVAVFGIGGVGGHAAEAVVRSGIGAIALFDKDKVSRSNINRQIIALESTVGIAKVDAAEARFLDINPELRVEKYELFFNEENAEQIDFSSYDYVIDAIDTVSSKLLLIEKACMAGVPVISAMGAGNKLNPSMFEVDDISKTSVCPLAKIMRKELKKRGIEHIKVVYSKEKPIEASKGRRTIGSVPFVPSAAGLILAGEVIRDLLGMR